MSTPTVLNDGTIEWRNEDGLLHCEDGPAVEWPDGTKEWWLNGFRHREDGPAVERPSGMNEWWLNGQCFFTEERFRAALQQSKSTNKTMNEPTTQTEDSTMRREAITEAVYKELDRAYKKHGRDQWGRHEFFAILKEEVDELWDAIKSDHPQGQVVMEAVQVAAMCFRYLETGDRYRAPSK